MVRSLKWSEEEWTPLLQSFFVGRAREVYSALSIDNSVQYKVVKTAVLKAYELVPEAYREKFWSSAENDFQTHVEFARQKEILFDRWCTSKEINDNFEKLQQLILVEDLKRAVCLVKLVCLVKSRHI